MIVKSKGMSTDKKGFRPQTPGLALPGWKLSEEVRIYPLDPDKLIVILFGFISMLRDLGFARENLAEVFEPGLRLS